MVRKLYLQNVSDPHRLRNVLIANKNSSAQVTKEIQNLPAKEEGNKGREANKAYVKDYFKDTFDLTKEYKFCHGHRK